MPTGSVGRRPQVPKRNQQWSVLAQKDSVDAVSWQTSSMEKRSGRLHRKDWLIFTSVIAKMSGKKNLKNNALRRFKTT